MKTEIAVNESYALKFQLLDDKRVILLCLYIPVICAAELVIRLTDPYLGMLLHLAIFFLLLIQGSFYHRHSISKLYLSTSLVPMVRILSLSMIIYDMPAIYLYPVIGVPLLAASYMVIKINRIKPKEIGLRTGNIPVQAIIGLMGIPLGLIECAILKPKPLIDVLSWQSLIVPALILLLFTGFLEELVFRGILYRVSVETRGKVFGLLYTSIFSAAMQITGFINVNVVFVFCVALVFGWLRERSNSLLGVSLAHGLLNIGLYLFWPFYSLSGITTIMSFWR